MSTRKKHCPVGACEQHCLELVSSHQQARVPWQVVFVGVCGNEVADESH